MNHPQSLRTINRRKFLALAGTALAAPYVAPHAWAATPPSERITMGIVGSGSMGMNNLQSFLKNKDCQVVAACDVDKDHLAHGVDTINKHYKNKDCKDYHDFREVMVRKDVDAVMIAVPDHWHELIAVEAAKNKKDIYGEKPLARTIAEQ